jgi:hypothetical protein
MAMAGYASFLLYPSEVNNVKVEIKGEIGSAVKRAVGFSLGQGFLSPAELEYLIKQHEKEKAGQCVKFKAHEVQCIGEKCKITDCAKNGRKTAAVISQR